MRGAQPQILAVSLPLLRPAQGKAVENVGLFCKQEDVQRKGDPKTQIAKEGKDHQDEKAK